MKHETEAFIMSIILIMIIALVVYRTLRSSLPKRNTKRNQVNSPIARIWDDKKMSDRKIDYQKSLEELMKN